jgi:hypothetical protein
MNILESLNVSTEANLNHTYKYGGGGEPLWLSGGLKNKEFATQP